MRERTLNLTIFGIKLFIELSVRVIVGLYFLIGGMALADTIGVAGDIILIAGVVMYTIDLCKKAVKWGDE